MDITFIIIIIIAIFFIGLFFVLVKNLVKTLMFSAGLIVIILILFGLFFYIDYRNFSNKIYDKNLLFLLEDNNEIVAGIQVKQLDEENFTAEKNFVSDSKLGEYSDLYQDKNYKNISEGYYKVFIFKNEAFGIETNENDFLEFIQQKMNNKGYIFIVREFKKGNIMIYPKSLLFKVAEISPISFIENIKKRVTDA